MRTFQIVRGIGKSIESRPELRWFWPVLGRSLRIALNLRRRPAVLMLVPPIACYRLGRSTPSGDESRSAAAAGRLLRQSFDETSRWPLIRIGQRQVALRERIV